MVLVDAEDLPQAHIDKCVAMEQQAIELCSKSVAWWKNKYIFWSDRKIEGHKKFVAAFSDKFVNRDEVSGDVLSVEDEEGFVKLKKQFRSQVYPPVSL